MQFLSAGHSDVGQVREHNEDFWFQDPELGLYIVCDGMGGHASGDVASQMTAETIAQIMTVQKRLLHAPGDPAERAMMLVQILAHAVEDANRIVNDASIEDRTKRGMGTTCTVLLINDGQGIMAHVGDSRLYLGRRGRLFQLSEDHTFLAEAVRRGVLTPQQAAESEHTNVITRAVGPQPQVEVDTLVFDVLPEDTLMLCSDGLHQYYEDEAELSALLGSEDVQSVPKALVDTANQRGGDDNITSLVVRALPTVPPRPDEAQRAKTVNANFDTLSAIDLFEEFSMPEMVRMCAAVRSVDFVGGDVIVKEGDESADALFVIVGGTAAVEREGQELTQLGAGSLFGEMALLTKRPRSATVRALSDCRMLVLDREHLYSLVQNDNVLGIKFLWKLAQTLSLRLDDSHVRVSATNRPTLRFGLFPSPFGD